MALSYAVSHISSAYLSGEVLFWCQNLVLSLVSFAVWLLRDLETSTWRNKGRKDGCHRSKPTGIHEDFCIWGELDIILLYLHSTMNCFCTRQKHLKGRPDPCQKLVHRERRRCKEQCTALSFDANSLILWNKACLILLLFQRSVYWEKAFAFTLQDWKKFSLEEDVSV